MVNRSATAHYNDEESVLRCVSLDVASGYAFVLCGYGARNGQGGTSGEQRRVEASVGISWGPSEKHTSYTVLREIFRMDLLLHSPTLPVLPTPLLHR